MIAKHVQQSTSAPILGVLTPSQVIQLAQKLSDSTVVAQQSRAAMQAVLEHYKNESPEDPYFVIEDQVTSTSIELITLFAAIHGTDDSPLDPNVLTDCTSTEIDFLYTAQAHCAKLHNEYRPMHSVASKVISNETAQNSNWQPVELETGEYVDHLNTRRAIPTRQRRAAFFARKPIAR